MMVFNPFRPGRPKLAVSLAEAFTNEPIVAKQIATFGEQRLSVMWKGSLVEAVWDISCKPISLTIDGEQFPTTDANTASHAIGAARRRAWQIVNQELDQLEARV